MCKFYDSPEAQASLKRLGLSEPAWLICDVCGEKQHIGDHPICWGKFGSHDPIAAYHPFVAWYDLQLGRQINSLADWNRAMKETGFEMADSKHDREKPVPKPSAKGFDRHFNEAVRSVYGGILPVGNFLTEED